MQKIAVAVLVGISIQLVTSIHDPWIVPYSVCHSSS